MNATTAGSINPMFVWAMASMAGVLAMAALVMLGDRRVMQALFAVAVIFLALGLPLSILFPNPLPGPQRPRSPGWDMGAPTPRAAAPKTVAAAVTVQPAATIASQGATAPGASPVAAGPGTRPSGLDALRAGGADDLARIKGAGQNWKSCAILLGFSILTRSRSGPPMKSPRSIRTLQGSSAGSCAMTGPH
jgi:hypothetical protein